MLPVVFTDRRYSLEKKFEKNNFSGNISCVCIVI